MTFNLNNYVAGCVEKGLTPVQIKKSLRGQPVYISFKDIVNEYNKLIGCSEISQLSCEPTSVCKPCKTEGFVDMKCEECPYMSNIKQVIEIQEIEAERIESYPEEIALLENGIRVLEDGVV